MKKNHFWFFYYYKLPYGNEVLFPTDIFRTVCNVLRMSSRFFAHLFATDTHSLITILMCHDSELLETSNNLRKFKNRSAFVSTINFSNFHYAPIVISIENFGPSLRKRKIEFDSIWSSVSIRISVEESRKLRRDFD